MTYVTKSIFTFFILMAGWGATFAQTTSTEKNNATHLALHNAEFNFIEDLGFHIYDLNATLHPKKAGDLVDFDAPDEFDIEIHSGKVLVKPATLTTVFDRQVLAYEDAQLKNVTISTAQDELTVKGNLKLMGVWLPLTMKGPIVLEDGLTLRLTPTHVKVMGMPVKSIMGALGMKMGHMVDLNHGGVTLDGDVIRLKAFDLFPPPNFLTEIQTVEVTPKGMELSFVSKNPVALNLPKLDSYVWMQGGKVRFFNMVIPDSHILVQSNKAETPVEFFLYNYRDQISQRGQVGMGRDGGISVVLSPENAKNTENAEKP